MVIALGNAVAQTGSKGKALEWLEIGSHGSTHIDTGIGDVMTVFLSQWVTSCFLYIF